MAVALTGIMMPTLATALVTSHAGRATSQQQLQATALLHEATDAMRSVQLDDWNAVAADGTYHTAISGGAWTLQSGPQTANGFTQEVVVSSAQRAAGGELVQSGGTDDSETKHVTITVSWTTPYDGSVSGDMVITHWRTAENIPQQGWQTAQWYSDGLLPVGDMAKGYWS